MGDATYHIGYGYAAAAMVNGKATANPVEGFSFWRDALAWHGAITPKLLIRIAVFSVYAAVVAVAHGLFAWRGPDVLHIAYVGGFLAVLLVLRTNASYDRWWEARKLWGGIVNQSRNLAIKAIAYGPKDRVWQERVVRCTASFCHAARLSLRGQRSQEALDRVLADGELVASIIAARHMPTRVASELGRLLQSARDESALDGFAFLDMERERNLFIDYVGACERILRTPLPRVHSIKLRRFILIYMLGVPLALATSSVWVMVVATALIAYPLLAIDQIAHELENPFSLERESHLPLDLICETIEKDLMALIPQRVEEVTTP